MTGPALRTALADLTLGAYEFAAIVKCEPATVYKWMKPGAAVPGYVETIVTLLRLLQATPVCPTDRIELLEEG